ncbi:hypothetical protein Calag_0992 [Caldisphaera lagunensis DSM 15908]|uniref:Uncharacterized protein n=1 Tax=Caldisphaera lagunensis (strain DSM 15908 / JCM 11604 / ANMR 0165 / IC-154) TaxID=1056495 RepID=L0ACE3_CALLD|nr:hypothetical protein [Caldisphaera lagunensis]AFZ70715.1 hypothetical protein Calag_0992 [Caldisphaera lagunensis DSM 15908]
MKGKGIMFSKVTFLQYLAMFGIPILLIISLILIPFHGIKYIRETILALIAIGSIAYGIIGLFEVYLKGGRS